MKRKPGKARPIGAVVRPGDFVPHEHAGAWPHALRAPAELPVSPRTHRRQAYSTALKDYRESRDSIPVREEGLSGGNWDHEQEARMGPRKGPGRPARADAEDMAGFWQRHGSRFSAGEMDLYDMFWVRRLSYQEIASQTGGTRERVYEAIKRLRRRRRGWME